ncbi:acyl-CoA dehydrogenase family protein [Streptomyces sp. NPDC051020]|uniref:acyl-CoA dehydrogenase family protein n=1 Tax=Streptomyces sp. NPDC051020 TaxID=3155409 RepID=UPI0034358846
MNTALHTAAEFEQMLGPARDRNTVFGYAACADLDEREEFPEAIARQLDGLGLCAKYVPIEYGGRLRTYEELLQLMRMVARRDLTVAIGHGKTYLGAVSAWVAATPEQAHRFGTDVAAGTVVSWGLTEQEHGSDLLAGELTATPADDGYRLDGEKWLINNATRGERICVLARTSPDGGPRGFSLMMVDKRELDPQSHRPLPRSRTHGIRGADISGIAFDGAVVTADSLIGTEGTGLETVLKSLQITRTLCAALSLGAADQGLRLALDFTLDARRYGRAVAELPQTTRTLTEYYADLLIGEAVSTVASRALHTLTEEHSVTAAVVKYLLPTSVDRMLTGLGQVLGLRSVVRADPDGAYGICPYGRFQKTERDHRIVGIFDGNTLVNLNALIDQFPTLVRRYRRGTDGADTAGPVAAARLCGPLPPFDRNRLVLASRTGNTVVATLSASAARLDEQAEAGLIPQRVARLAGQLARHTDTLHDRMAAIRRTARDVPSEAFEIAEEYVLCHAAAACLLLWLHNAPERVVPDDPAPDAALWRDACWLQAALARIQARLTPGGAQPDGDALDALYPQLVAQHREGLLFSLLYCPVSEEAPA